jgi:uncharacterized protein (TIGR03437 family)
MRALCLIVLLLSLPAYAAQSDALALLANIQAKHLPFGTVLDPMYASPTSTQITGYTRCGDSAIWTGHYLAAEAFRYRVTGAADALANVQGAIAGIKSLVDITGTDVLARCLVPSASPFAAGIASEEAANGIYTNKQAGYIWVGNTSRDEYCGVMFGLGVAYDMVDDAGVKQSIGTLVTRILNFLQNHAWTIVLPDFSISTTFLSRNDQILSFLQVGQHVNPSQFAQSYNSMLSGAPEMLVPIGLEITSNSSYFKFNLDYINLYSLERLESGSVKSTYDAAYSLLHLHTASHQNAFFNMIDRAINGPNATRDAETLGLLDAWLQRPARDFYVDVTSQVAVCGTEACNPVPVAMRPPTDFLWQRDPFQLSGGGMGTIESAGIDYILPYWMAQFYGVGQAFTVQSAAAGLGIAPGSIASAYGSGFASNATVLVNGVAAQLFYVSSSQINFLIPPQTATGTATFTIGTATSTATVSTIAPALFSANGSGFGVAAATAVRTQAGNPGMQTPLAVVQCGSSGCTSIPIDTGVDTPVYLSLYGTGIRKLSSMAAVTCTINGISVPVLYAGPQGQFAGLDQVNVPLTLNLRGSGESNVVLTVDGHTANAVTINVQ